MTDVPLEERSFSAATPDGSVFVRVAAPGHVLGVQLEPAVMGRSGSEIAERVMACADKAYLESQVLRREAWEAEHVPPEAYEWMPERGELDAARARLERL